MQEQSPSQDFDLVILWEQMGASTGSFLGKVIGLAAQYGLDVYEQIIVNPLRQSAPINGATASGMGIPADIREQTWRKMGKEYGETIGTSIGMAMDLLINSLKASIKKN